MITNSLKDFLKSNIPYAKEIWIISAMITDEGFETLLDELPANIKQNYLVGINLPTSLNVLQKLKDLHNENTFKARISKPNSYSFHPKVYIIKNTNNYTAYIGSANLTVGGLSENVEMGYILDVETECLKIISWFQDLYSEAYPIDRENLSEYATFVNGTSASQNEIKNKRRKIKLKKPEINSIDSKLKKELEKVDFSDQFFKFEHFWAFRPSLWRDYLPSANRERKKTYDRFQDLHELIYPSFGKSILININPHYNRDYVISHYIHQDNFTSDDMNAIWLSYGKSKSEILKYKELFPKVSFRKADQDEDDKQSFINHARIQIIVRNNLVGIWLLFGKNNNGSLFDRNHFFDRMKENVYRQEFYLKVKTLPESYWISVNQNIRNCSEFNSSEELYNHCKMDDPEKYFIIGTDYDYASSEISKENIQNTVIKEFLRLYPLYELMRDKMFKSNNI